jgi:UDP-glucose 4-epimerase
MTRFVMTLSQSVDLIEHAIMHEGVDGGDTIIPELISMRVKDLVEIFSEKYNKPIRVTGLRPGEKMLESLINHTQSIRMIKEDGYYHIKSAISYKGKLDLENEMDYNSDINPLNKDELKTYLEKLNLI